MYKCLDCGHVFQEGLEKRFREPHGEEYDGCPICGGAFEEALACVICGDALLEDERVYGCICKTCVIGTITPDRTLAYVQDKGLEDAFFDWFFSPEEKLALFRGRFAQLKVLDTLKHERNVTKRCIDFVNEDEVGLCDYAEWEAKKSLDD